MSLKNKRRRKARVVDKAYNNYDYLTCRFVSGQLAYMDSKDWGAYNGETL